MKNLIQKKINLGLHVVVSFCLVLSTVSCESGGSSLTPTPDITKITETITETCVDPSVSAGAPVTTVNTDTVTINPEALSQGCTAVPEEVIVYVPVPEENTEEPEPTPTPVPTPEPNEKPTFKTCTTKPLYERVPSELDLLMTGRLNDFFHSIFGKALLNHPETQTLVDGAIGGLDKIFSSFNQSVNNFESVSLFGNFAPADPALDEDAEESLGLIFQFYRPLTDAAFNEFAAQIEKNDIVIEDLYPGNPSTLKLGFVSASQTQVKVSLEADLYDSNSESFQTKDLPVECLIEKQFVTCAYDSKSQSTSYLDGLIAVRDGKYPSMAESDLPSVLKCDTFQGYINAEILNESAQSDFETEEAAQLAEESTLGGEFVASLNVFPATIFDKKDADPFGFARFTLSYKVLDHWVGRVTVELSDWITQYVTKYIQQALTASDAGVDPTLEPIDPDAYDGNGPIGKP